MILIFFLWLASTTKTIAAQDPGHFINPPIAEGPEDYGNNLVWAVGETQKIQWTTIYPSFTIALWQQDLGGGGGREGPTIFVTPPNNALSVTEFSWNVAIFQFDFSRSNVFFLWLKPAPITGQAESTSHYFNISLVDTTKITSSSRTLPSPSHSSTSSAISSSIVTQSASTTSSISASTTSQSSAATTASDSEAKPGGGVIAGSVVGASAIFFLGGILFWFLRKRGKGEVNSQNSRQAQNADSLNPALGNMFWSKWQQIPARSPDHKGTNNVELSPIRQEASELPGEQRRAPISELP